MVLRKGKALFYFWHRQPLAGPEKIYRFNQGNRFFNEEQKEKLFNKNILKLIKI